MFHTIDITPVHHTGPIFSQHSTLEFTHCTLTVTAFRYREHHSY